MRVSTSNGEIAAASNVDLCSITSALTVSGEVIHEPLWVENLSPLAQLVALPSQRSADIKEGLSVSVHTDIATHFVSQASGRERYFLTGRHKSTALIFDGVCRPSGNWRACLVHQT